MKTKLLIGLLFLARLGSASAVTFIYTGPTYSIPDGNPVGAWSSITVNGMGPLLDVRVTLNLNGGYNGDLYAYLSYGGALVPLLNRPGVSGTNSFGAGGAGMNVTLTDAGAGNIHAIGNSFASGFFRPDGQNISPLSAPASFSATGGTITLNGTFGGFNPNGEWTLFVADVVSGGGASVLNSWGLQVTAVPEPGYISFATALLLGAMILRRRKQATSLVAANVNSRSMNRKRLSAD